MHTSDGRSGIGSGVLAIIGCGPKVGIGRLGVDTLVGNDVSEGIIHQTTVASVVSIGLRAIH